MCWHYSQPGSHRMQGVIYLRLMARDWAKVRLAKIAERQQGCGRGWRGEESEFRLKLKMGAGKEKQRIGLKESSCVMPVSGLLDWN